MCPRARKKENSHLPQGLYKRILRGKLRYRFRYKDGTERYFPIGTEEADAIQEVILCNSSQRPPILIQDVLQPKDSFNKPLKYWIPIIKKRVEAEELLTSKIGDQIFKGFCHDLERLSKLHGNTLSKDIDLKLVNNFLATVAENKSNNLFNKKITFLKKTFSYIIDLGGMETNFADLKKRKPKDIVQRKRLSLSAFKKMSKKAPLFIKIAMNVSLQTTHSIHEVCHLKYSDCTWYDEPLIENEIKVYGVMKIHRKKVKEKEASRVAIPITKRLKEIIKESKSDGIESPFIVHKSFIRNYEKMENKEHNTQLRTSYLTKAFTKLRDELKLYSHLKPKERPTFHEIRALAIYQYDQSGVDPQARAAHTDAESTKLYKKGHVKWIKVAAAELDI
ncbi:tyrosine-type recombinase/integrase [Colwellia sp. Bg11-28]|uniref:tyrosine-type recombinase/integrase n=1 Tax=Colwellia sp. Bg11-28 TaxID=2058305 RepID=UPI000C3216DC|nr:tyrosine-type recombinase/integrase [Colwellia sp. Bg11-28]PKH86904.1 integrase [Colwellia sp. Bg11-28]